MNGAELPRSHGYPVRLIAPGWYGVANVKWLTHIEVWDQQYRGQFMARDYVTIREQVRDGKVVWTFANVRHDRLKSSPAKVTRRGDRQPSHGRDAKKFAWKFWTWHWENPTPGLRTVRSRAFDVDGKMQPPPNDPFLASKVTFWESNGQIGRKVLIPAS